jgi:hypothetical protein
MKGIMNDMQTQPDEKVRITLAKDVVQNGDIKVHSQIINDLSSGIYSSPATCIKELINNSFDADANLVTIRIKPVEDIITIIDDGDGMNAVDFDNNFAWISKSNKRNQGQYSKKGRPLIGKIGIGFIAVNEICDSLEITSSKRDEDIKFTATIDFKKYNDTPTKIDGGLIKAGFELLNSDEDRNLHYTTIKLLGLKEGVKEILNDMQELSKLAAQKNKNFSKSTFRNMRSMLAQHLEKKIRTFSEDNAYVQFLINLASYVPVEYIEDGPIKGVTADKIINELIQRHKDFNFKVDVDGVYLKKPVLLGNENGIEYKYSTFSKDLIIEDKHLKFKGYFYTQNKLLFPRELNGVSIKIRNVPIASRYGYDTSFMGYPRYVNQLLSNWISGEIYVDEGLEDAMNIDRQSFRETHPEYMVLQNFLHEFLSKDFFPKFVLPIYEAGRKNRETKKDKEEKDILKRSLNISEVVVTQIKDPAKVTKNTPPISIKYDDSKKTTIEVQQSFFKSIKKNDWNYLEKVVLIFETAIKESKGDVNKMKVIFYEKISLWLKKDND